MKLIQKYFPKLNSRQLEQFSKMKEIYYYWNKKINLISRKSFESFYQNHVLHSLGIAKIVSIMPGSNIMDVGTGGGFPGIPLAILFPDSDFLMVDYREKKIKATKSISKELFLNNVRTICIRAEKTKGKFDFILNRAVTKIPRFYAWVKGKFISKSKHIIPNGIFYIKGGDLSEELRLFPKAIEFTLMNYFKIAFFYGKKVVYLPCKSKVFF